MEKPNDHHILFSRPAWTSNSDAAHLREDSGLIARMDYHTHMALHREVPFVPLLDHFSLQRVRNIMRRSRADKPLDVMDDFILAIEETSHNPKTRALERDLGELTIRSLDMQRPFITEGMIKAQVFDMGRK